MISIVTCAYKPVKEIYSRTIGAIEQIYAATNSAIEYIIVDNNSQPPVSDTEYIRSFAEKNKNWVRIVNEKKPGLGWSRIKAIAESKGDWIVFFDHDNEPSADYINNLLKLINDHPEVGVWGSGEIKVEFIGGAEKWVEKFGRPKLQEMHTPGTLFSSNVLTFEHLPFGTGLAARKDVLNKYAATTQRSEDTDKHLVLHCCNDIQISYEAAQMKMQAGRSDQLSINHLISADRATYTAIKKLYYSYELEKYNLVAQYFPGQVSPMQSKIKEQVSFIYWIVRSWFSHLVRYGNWKMAKCGAAGVVGYKEGKLIYHKRKVLSSVRMFKSLLRL